MITVQINEYNQPTTLAVVVGGGPAPGINSVIRALTIQAKNYAKFEMGQYLRVIGFIGGFSTLIDGDPNKVQYKELNIDYTSRIHKTGGSIINTSRTSPLNFLSNVVNNLIHYNVRYLCTIGGDGTALVSAKIAEAITKMNKHIQVVHVPKTIDNDLPLPGGAVTFGFETAKQVGSSIVQNLIYDARSIDGYHLVITMGRTTGHLAFGIGKSTGACLTVIPEDYHKGKFRMEHLLLDIELCVMKRMWKRGHNYGTIIVAEGLLCHMPEEDLIKYFGDESTAKDANALHIDLGKIDIGDFIRDHLRAKKLYPFSFHVCRLGYELRCADPNAFDISYTMDLGHGAANFLLQHNGSHAMVIEVAKNIEYMPFSELLDSTGKTKLRFLDINHGGYRVGAKLNKMNRFEKEDLEDAALMAKVKEAGISVDAIKELVFDVRRYPDYIEPDKSLPKTQEEKDKVEKDELEAFQA